MRLKTDFGLLVNHVWADYRLDMPLVNVARFRRENFIATIAAKSGIVFIEDMDRLDGLVYDISYECGWPGLEVMPAFSQIKKLFKNRIHNGVSTHDLAWLSDALNEIAPDN